MERRETMSRIHKRITRDFHLLLEMNKFYFMSEGLFSPRREINPNAKYILTIILAID